MPRPRAAVTLAAPLLFAPAASAVQTAELVPSFPDPPLPFPGMAGAGAGAGPPPIDPLLMASIIEQAKELEDAHRKRVLQERRTAAERIMAEMDLRNNSS